MRGSFRGDLPKLGVKTFFCSNVCAMYDRRTYEELGGFVESTLFNEDMIYAGHLVQAGYAIAYAADAKVWHWHNYTANSFTAISTSVYPRHRIRRSLMRIRLRVRESVW